MSQQPINPLWSIRDTAGQKSLSMSLQTPRQAIQYKDMFEARRLSASCIGESVCLFIQNAHTHTHLQGKPAKGRTKDAPPPLRTDQQCFAA